MDATVKSVRLKVEMQFLEHENEMRRIQLMQEMIAITMMKPASFRPAV